MVDFFFHYTPDKVFVFLDSNGGISFVLPWINFDYIYIAVLVCISLYYIFEVFNVFLSHWRTDHL